MYIRRSSNWRLLRHLKLTTATVFPTLISATRSFTAFFDIIQKRMGEETRPVCHVVAGPNGSGKSTFALRYLPEYAGAVDFSALAEPMRQELGI